MKINIAIPIPLNSKIVVELEDKLKKNSLIAVKDETDSQKIIHLARLLRILPGRMQKYMQKSAGQKIYAGDIVAEKKGLFFSTSIKSPTDGVISEINLKTGTLSITPSKSKGESELTTPVAGIVRKLGREEITLEIEGSVFEGKYTEGTDVMGILKNLSKDIYDIFDIDQRVAEKVLLGKSFRSDIISKVEVLGARGLISVEKIVQTEIPYILTDEETLRALAEHDGKTVWLRTSKKQIVILD